MEAGWSRHSLAVNLPESSESNPHTDPLGRHFPGILFTKGPAGRVQENIGRSAVHAFKQLLPATGRLPFLSLGATSHMLLLRPLMASPSPSGSQRGACRENAHSGTVP